jgi:hypothetical protein
MGTRRSRHNMGRKPSYKEHGHDSARNFVERVERIANQPTIPTRHRPAPSPCPELEAQVARYLAARKAEAEAALLAEKNRLASVRRAEINHTGIHVEPPILEELIVSVSDRDIPLQLYMARKISLNQLQCARLWQHYIEESTLQPSCSIDPSAPLQWKVWQRDGDMSEQQYRALTIRKFAIFAFGKARALFLDTILAPDVGRKRAIELFRAPWPRLQYELLWCLNALSIYFGRSNGYSGDGMDAFREAADKQQRYRENWAREIFGENYEARNARQMKYLDAEAHTNAVPTL